MKTRHEILKECPEEFQTELQNWIDELETEVLVMISDLNSINGISDLGRVETAYIDLINLAKKLY